MSEQKPEISFEDSKKRPINEALATGAVIGTSSIALASPALASEAVAAMLTSVSGVAASAIAIVVVAMGARLAIKQVNRILTKG